MINMGHDCHVVNIFLQLHLGYLQQTIFVKTGWGIYLVCRKLQKAEAQRRSSFLGADIHFVMLAVIFQIITQQLSITAT